MRLMLFSCIFLFLSGCSLTGGSLLGASGKPRNVIVFVGDGMGPSTVTAVRILEGQLRGEMGEENVLSWERFPNVALSKTYNTNQQIPDSAGTATAIFSGEKTKAGVLGLGPGVQRSVCAGSDRFQLPSVLRLAEREGLSTGIVTTARITHATPAALYARSPEREWESDADLPTEAKINGCLDIAEQWLNFDEGNGVDVVFAGGRQKMLPVSEADPEYPEIKGKRQDGRNLIAEWELRHPKGKYIWNLQQFEDLDVQGLSHILGLFQPDHMRFELERLEDKAGEPSIADMTRKAIEILRNNDRGYLLVVEAGRIDRGHHQGRAALALHDGVALAKAVDVADLMTNDSDTFILVTADHSHGFTMSGYPTRGNPILGKVLANDENGNPKEAYEIATDGKPYTTLGYYTGQGSVFYKNSTAVVEREDVTHINTSDGRYKQQSTVPLRSEAHGGEDVAIYAKGPGAEKIRGVMEQNRIFDVISAFK